MLRPARAAFGAHACACGAHACAHLWVGGVLRVQGGAVLVQARQHRFEERPRRHARPRVGCGEGRHQVPERLEARAALAAAHHHLPVRGSCWQARAAQVSTRIVGRRAAPFQLSLFLPAPRKVLPQDPSTAAPPVREQSRGAGAAARARGWLDSDFLLPNRLPFLRCDEGADATVIHSWQVAAPALARAGGERENTNRENARPRTTQARSRQGRADRAGRAGRL